MDGIRLEITGADTIIAEFSNAPAVVNRALVRALNRAVGSGRTVMVRSIAVDTGLKQKDVRDKLVLQEATFTRPAASLAATLKRIPLMDFNAKGPSPSRGKGHGVRARLPGGAGVYPNAFIATMRSGHVGVFQRKGKARLPIRELYGPSLGHVFIKYRPPTEARILEAFESNFDHELDFAATPAAGTQDVGAGTD